MINQLKGFFSSQRQLLKGWELPVAGLLLTTGLAISVATLKTTSSQHKAQAANYIAAPSTVETAQAPQSQEPVQGIDSSVAPSTVETAQAPQPQAPGQGIDSSVAPSTVETAQAPQSREPAVDSLALTSKKSEVSKSYNTHKGVIHSPAVSSKVTVAPQQQEQSFDSPSVPSTGTAAVPQQEQALDTQPLAKPSVKWNRKAQERPKSPIAQVPKQDSSLQDGTYLYGQSSQPGEIGKEYIVFQANQGKVVGAMYMPSSEYACFYGTLNSKQMNLTVVNPYNQTAFSHTIAREQQTQVAAASGQINLENTYDSLTYPHSIGLEGYLPINQVGDNDKQILNTCVSNYQSKVSTQ